MRATIVGTIIGTAAYMSPEQAKGKPVDRHADIWAFGVVLYETLTGERAFVGDSATELLGAVIHKEPDLDRAPLKDVAEAGLERKASKVSREGSRKRSSKTYGLALVM